MGGAGGAVRICEMAGADDCITDMGGTGTDVALIHQLMPRISHRTDRRLSLQVLQLDIHTIGAGGGSIAWFSRMGRLKSDRSAGAMPGPAYQRGARNRLFPMPT